MLHESEMALTSLSVLLLLLEFLPSFGAPAAGAVFVLGQSANDVLQRHKRHNSGFFEELMEGNLKRECVEEMCNLEEARETFENDEQTMEFWARYVDGNHCKSSPCLNQGSCKDHLGHYTCSCESSFTGKNCEIALAKRCDVNNGDCMHFCELMGNFGAKCSCAQGYMLMEDGTNCEAEVEFPCGRTALAEVSLSSVSPRSLLPRVDAVPPNATSLSNSSTTTIPTTSPPSTPASTTESIHPENSSEEILPTWMYNYSEAPSEEPIKPYKRIVGGEVVIPGEIPWQVALVAHPSDQVFCGGTILSQRWIITAAHCVVEAQSAFVVRVGEHNIYINEGTEEDIEVLEVHMHPRYNISQSLYNHDIALLYLKGSITFSSTVRPICIGPKSFIETLVKAAAPATVSGWGRMRFLGSTASALQKVEVPYTDRTECKKSSTARITPVMFCAGFYDEAKDACQGDSGGPHTNSIHDTWFLTGIVSWGEKCAKEGKYGVYTRVSLYYRWINHVMGLTSHRLAVVDLEDPDL